MGIAAAVLAFSGYTAIAKDGKGTLPNIVYILADDLGYGDVSALNPESKIQTPNIDRLANEGMRFTDAHSGSAVCTPTVCDDTTCLTDLLATCADIVGENLPDNAGEDSVSMLPNLLGTAKEPLREATVHHSINGSFSIRRGKWKLALCPGSGGWSDPKPGETKGLPPVQLYDLENDIAETKNVQEKHPEIVKELTALLETYKSAGRSVLR